MIVKIKPHEKGQKKTMLCPESCVKKEPTTKGLVYSRSDNNEAWKRTHFVKNFLCALETFVSKILLTFYFGSLALTNKINIFKLAKNNPISDINCYF